MIDNNVENDKGIYPLPLIIMSLSLSPPLCFSVIIQSFNSEKDIFYLFFVIDVIKLVEQIDIRFKKIRSKLC